jgi:hypothetical protein
MYGLGIFFVQNLRLAEKTFVWRKYNRKIPGNYLNCKQKQRRGQICHYILTFGSGSVDYLVKMGEATGRRICRGRHLLNVKGKIKTVGGIKKWL